MYKIHKDRAININKMHTRTHTHIYIYMAVSFLLCVLKTPLFTWVVLRLVVLYIWRFLVCSRRHSRHAGWGLQANKTTTPKQKKYPRNDVFFFWNSDFFRIAFQSTLPLKKPAWSFQSLEHRRSPPPPDRQCSIYTSCWPQVLYSA